MLPSTRRLAPLLATLALAAGCASAPAPRETTTAPAPIVAVPDTALLAPPPAAIRTADRVELTGLELGKMWTLQDPPIERWERLYGFAPDEAWLDEVQAAALRFGAICSASFVSPDGLVLTNHHCARGCIHELSTADEDLLEDGFHAASRGGERVCPDLYVDQLRSVENVTDSVRAAGAGLEADTAVARAQADRIEEIEQDCEAGTGLSCEVVPLWQGARFHLYRYARHQPVKLVWAPENQAADFGGDWDNFTYPRYALDVAFLRAYGEDDAPIRPDHWLTLDEEGAAEGDVVFVVGSPGSTSRLFSVSQLMYAKHRSHQYAVRYIGDYVDLLRWIASFGPRAERLVRDDLATFENSLKAYTGELEGLQDTLLVGRKIRWESEIRRSVMDDPGLRAEYGDVWDALADIQASKVPVEQRLSIYDVENVGDPHLGLAGLLIRYLRESEKPPEQRMEGYDEERLAELEEELRAETPVNQAIAERLLAIRLRVAREFLPPDDPFLVAAFRPGESPEQAAERIVRRSRVGDAGFRRRLLRGGPEAVAAEEDVAVRLARIMEASHPRLRETMETLMAREAVQSERLADAVFAVGGTRIPSDGTLTLRIIDGVVTGYEYNGTLAPPKTSFYGIFERSNNFDHEMPFALPAGYIAARDRIDMDTPLNFVTTNDITGGASGSPMIDRDGEIVGVAFDGNIESLPMEWLYDDTVARSVGVHSAGILHALRSIYRAESLVRELMRR